MYNLGRIKANPLVAKVPYMLCQGLFSSPKFVFLTVQVAIKTIKKSKIETEADLIRIRREIQIMSSVQHPNIIHIYEGTYVHSLRTYISNRVI